MKFPRDSKRYRRDRRSHPIDTGIDDGGYAYVRDVNGVIHVLPDGPHVHPRVLGGNQPAMYAGDLTIEDGRVIDVTNLSGTFRFDDSEGLLNTADELERLGLEIIPFAVRLFPYDGSTPIVLR